jgi:hypothetical protein
MNEIIRHARKDGLLLLSLRAHIVLRLMICMSTNGGGICIYGNVSKWKELKQE